jgi:hypothetical protein
MASGILKSASLIAIVILAAIGGAAFLVREASAISPNPNARNVTLYWHYSNTPESVGAIQTHYVLNTTSKFDFTTQQSAKQNAFYKPSTLPSITVDFFVYPNLAGSANVNGSWQVFVWANASASTPVVFNLEFREFHLGSGTATYDSGLITPIVTSSVGKNLDVPVNAYNLTAPALAHTFAQGSTIDVSVTVNTGAASDTRIWYDSSFYPSKVILPVVNPGQPAMIWTETATGVVTSVFLATAGLKVLVNANVTDPFGGYDINATVTGSKFTTANLSITAPNGTMIVTGQRMTLMSGGPLALNNILQYNETLPLGMVGEYSVVVSSTDNSGNVEQLTFIFTLGQTYKLGAYIVDSQNRPLPGSILTVWSSGLEVFSGAASSSGTVNGTLVSANYTIKISWQGVTVYQSPVNFAGNTNLVLVTAVYNPTIVVVDDTGATLSGAVVAITNPNGTALPGFVTTGANGNISLTEAPAGAWGLTVLWKTVNVFSNTIQISSNGPYTIKTMVYQLKVIVNGSTGQAVQGAYVVLYNSYGVVYDFKATDASGSVTLKVPIGTYTVVGLYSSTYLYTPVTASTNKTGVVINSSGSLTLTLSGYPPSIFSTSEFLVLALAIVAVAAAILVTYLVMKKRLPGMKSRKQDSPPSSTNTS